MVMKAQKQLLFGSLRKKLALKVMECYSAIEKNEIMPFAATWMDLEIIILSEVSQTEKDKYQYITYMWNLKKNDTDELIYKIETDT